MNLALTSDTKIITNMIGKIKREIGNHKDITNMISKRISRKRILKDSAKNHKYDIQKE